MSSDNTLKNQALETPTLAEGRQMTGHSDVTLIGTLIENKYRVIERLGQGGMGSVYKAHHELLNRMVAVKLLNSNLLESDDYVERFRREASVAGSLNHPNAIALFDYGLHEGVPFLVMQYVEGVTLKQELLRGGAMSLERIEKILSQIGGALGVAHGLGIVHRDLKPDNIMIAKRGDGTEWAWILDFGIAKPLNGLSATGSAALTRAGMLMGTPQYMSPEQALDRPCDTRSDIYSLGCILYEMLTGDVPFKSASPVELMYQQVSKVPVPVREFNKALDIPQSVSDVVMKALEKEPERRIQTVGELVTAFSAAVRTEPSALSAFETAFNSTVNSATSTMHSVAAQSRKRWPLIVGAFGVVGLVVGGAFLARQPAVDEAEKVAEEQVPETVVPAAKSPENMPAAKVLSAVEISFTFVPPVNPTPPLGVVATPPSVSEQAQSEALVMELPQDAAPAVEKSDETVAPELPPIEIAPTEVAPSQELSQSVAEDSLSVEAITAERKASPRRESKADADRLYAEGQKLFSARDYQGAAAKFKEALLFREKQLAARLSLGVSLLRLGKADAALEHFKVAEAQNPEYPPTIYNFASYYATVGDTEQAVRELKRAFALYPKLKSWPATDPDFDRIREEEAFKALFQR